LPAAVQRVIDLLDKLPNGDLLPTADIARAIGLVYGSMHENSTHPSLKDYKERSDSPSHGNLWGNKRTIKAFREMKANGKDNS